MNDPQGESLSEWLAEMVAHPFHWPAADTYVVPPRVDGPCPWDQWLPGENQ